MLSGGYPLKKSQSVSVFIPLRLVSNITMSLREKLLCYALVVLSPVSPQPEQLFLTTRLVFLRPAPVMGAVAAIESQLFHRSALAGKVNPGRCPSISAPRQQPDPDLLTVSSLENDWFCQKRRRRF